jgi:hypothetical protein
MRPDWGLVNRRAAIGDWRIASAETLAGLESELENPSTSRLKSVFRPILIFLAGALCGSVVAFLAYDYGARRLNDALQFSELALAGQLAESAYFEQSPQIAEWELAKLIPRIAIPPKAPFYPDDQRKLALFLAHARLAKVQKVQGKEADAERNHAIAREFAEQLFPNHPPVAGDLVFQLLSKFDRPTDSK